MIITQAHLNNTYNIEGFTGTMIYSALVNFVGMEFEDVSKAMALKAWDICRGDKVTQRSLLKMVKEHVSK